MNIQFFNNKDEFHSFLMKNYDSSLGIWIKFDKHNTPDKLTPKEALNEALCFGWIDGQIKRLDDDFYIKYFCKRRQKSIWSSRNKTIAEKLIKNNQMNSHGQKQIDEAKKDGRWDKSDSLPDDFSKEHFIDLLKINQKAQKNYLAMSPSKQKTYATSYFILKKKDSRERRLSKIIERLLENKPPM